jgi:hypothetical protein
MLRVSMNIFSQEKNDTTAIVQLLKEDYKTMATWDIKKQMGNYTDTFHTI